jgi:uncharacterized membrane protein
MNKILTKIVVAWFFFITGILSLIALFAYGFYLLWPFSGYLSLIVIMIVGFFASAEYLFGNKYDDDKYDDIDDDKYDDIGW